MLEMSSDLRENRSEYAVGYGQTSFNSHQGPAMVSTRTEHDGLDGSDLQYNSDIKNTGSQTNYLFEQALNFSSIVNEHVIQIVPETPLSQILTVFKQLDLK